MELAKNNYLIDSPISMWNAIEPQKKYSHFISSTQTSCIAPDPHQQFSWF
jgi:hypothetical protein